MFGSERDVPKVYEGKREAYAKGVVTNQDGSETWGANGPAVVRDDEGNIIGTKYAQGSEQ